MTVPVEAYVALSAVLFAIGAIGVMLRRNALVVLLSIEIMLNAANLALVAFSRMHGDHDGQIFSVVAMAVAASEVVVGLGLVVAIANLRKSLDTDALAELHG
jgi:NADH-quinone oxidoreductase subunit K